MMLTEETQSTQRGYAATKARNISRKDAKAAKKIPLSSPFGKGGKRGICLSGIPLSGADLARE
jgi:hypothetical protein